MDDKRRDKGQSTGGEGGGRPEGETSQKIESAGGDSEGISEGGMGE
jgi:hypothetical protein